MAAGPAPTKRGPETEPKLTVLGRVACSTPRTATPKKRPLSPNTGDSPELKKVKDLPSPLFIPESPEITTDDSDDSDITSAEISSFLHQFDGVLTEPGDGAEASAAATEVAVAEEGTTVPPSPSSAGPDPEPTNVTPPTTTQKSPTPPSATPPPVTQIMWVSITLTIIAGSSSKITQGTKELVHRAFLKYLPSSVLRSRGTWLNFQVRHDALARAKLFPGINKLDVRVDETTKKRSKTQSTGQQQKSRVQYSKGIINTGNMSWPTKEACERYFQIGKNQIHAINIIPQAVKVTFKSSIIPATITTLDNICHQVMPALLTAIRCNKCQKHGHPTAACRTETVKCPHCAGPHSHSECKNKTKKKCANCQGPHGAAYKGCSSYSKYITNLANQNQNIIKTHFQNKPNFTTPRVQEKHNAENERKQIKSIILAVLKETNQTPTENLDKIIDEQINKNQNSQNQAEPPKSKNQIKNKNMVQTGSQAKHPPKMRNTRPMHPLGSNEPILGYWRYPYPPSHFRAIKPRGWLTNRFSVLY